MLVHKFVKSAPDTLEDGVIYVSVEYASAMHKCCCGCGHEVVTPFSPTDWQLTFDGRSISLYPSIGNWSFKCQSHYWIRNNRVEWCPKWDNANAAKNSKMSSPRKVKESFFKTFFRKKSARK